jgi:hypothetical protein
VSHKVPGCDGRWIRIGTFADPDLQKCSKCRATRKSKSDVDEEEPPRIPVHSDDEPKETGPASPLVPLVILVAGIAAGLWIATLFR